MCSTFKVLAAAAVLDRNPPEHLDHRVCYRAADVVPFSPITESQVDGGLTIRELCDAAIRYSDNTAGNLLLDDVDRALLTSWLVGNTTGDTRIRAGLPADWRVGDKTGAGRYGVVNDVAITWPPGAAPIVLAVLSTRPTVDADGDNMLIAQAATVVADKLGRTLTAEASVLARRLGVPALRPGIDRPSSGCLVALPGTWGFSPTPTLVHTTIHSRHHLGRRPAHLVGSGEATGCVDHLAGEPATVMADEQGNDVGDVG